uniref:Uncharacterized protein n=1 Tax=Arundo donax TaxID=35708 RepID=A0A0A9A3T4_ARUDO
MAPQEQSQLGPAGQPSLESNDQDQPRLGHTVAPPKATTTESNKSTLLST